MVRRRGGGFILQPIFYFLFLIKKSIPKCLSSSAPSSKTTKHNNEKKTKKPQKVAHEITQNIEYPKVCFTPLLSLPFYFFLHALHFYRNSINLSTSPFYRTPFIPLNTMDQGGLTMEFLLSKPLLPEAEKSHLQKVLTCLVGTLDGVQTKVNAMEKTMLRTSDATDDNTQNVHILTTQVKQLQHVMESLRHEHPIKKDLDDMRKSHALHQESVVELRGTVDVLRGVVDSRNRSSDEFKINLSNQVESLQRDVDVRNRSVTDAMNDLANRVDSKTDAADLDRVVAQMEDANKRQGAEFDGLRRSIISADELVKRQQVDIEQLRLTLLARDRQQAEQIATMEAAIDAASKRNNQAALSEMNDLRNAFHTHTRSTEDTVHNMERDMDGRFNGVEQRMTTRLDEIVSRRTVGMDDGLQRMRELVTRMQGDVAATNDQVAKVESDCRGNYNRLRDDTDNKLLELLNAVQGVEHSKAALERQVAEAGRILCQGIPIFTSAVADSPPSLKGRGRSSHGHHHAHSDSGLNDADGRGASYSPQRPPTAVGQAYKTGPGVLCSCDDDIF